MLRKRNNFLCLPCERGCSVLLPKPILKGPQGPFTCFAPSTTGTMHSGSVACVLSSMRMERNCILARRGSPAPTHVQQITSAFWGTGKGFGVSIGV